MTPRPRQPVTIWHTAAFTCLLAVLLAAVLFPVLPSRLHVSEGDIASQTVRSPREVQYNSEVLRRQIQDQRRNATPDVVVYDVNVRDQQRARLSEILDRITSIRNT